MLSNSAYTEAEDSTKIIEDMVAAINKDFDVAVREIVDPGYEDRKEREMLSNPLFAAGIRSFERMRWDLEAGLDPFAK